MGSGTVEAQTTQVMEAQRGEDGTEGEPGE